MTIDEIIAHIMETPENTNPAVLRDQLTQLAGNNVEGAPSTNLEDVFILELTVTDDNVLDYNDYDGGGQE